MKPYSLVYLSTALNLSLFISTCHALNINKRSIFRLNRMKRMNNNKISQDNFAHDHNDWLAIRKNSEFAVDKTHAIEELEQSGQYLNFCRPKGFGKSLLCAQLKLYYDINTSDETVSRLPLTYIIFNIVIFMYII